MNNAQRYLEKIREELRARGMRDSDHQVAKSLDVSRASIHRWKNGTGGVGIIDSYKIALFLNLNTLEVVGELYQDEFKSDEEKAFGQELLKTIHDKDVA